MITVRRDAVRTQPSDLIETSPFGEIDAADRVKGLTQT
jgi:hypothetical protein